MNKEKNEHSPAEISDMDAYIGYWLRFVSNQVTNAFQQKLATKDTTIAEWLVLRFLWSNAPSSSTRLCTELVIDKGVMSRLSDKLEKRQLITRLVDQKDRRLYSIELTAQGRKLVPMLAQLADENDAQFFSHLPEKNINSIMKFLKDLIKHHELTQKPID